MKANHVIAAAAGAMLLASPAAAQVEIKLGIFLPPFVSYMKQGYLPWIEEVNKAAEGTIKLTWYRGNALGNARTLYRNIVTGVADAGLHFQSAAPGKFVTSPVVGFPFVADGPKDSSEAASVAFWRIYEKGLLDHEYDEVKSIEMVNLPPLQLYSAKPIRNLEEIKGLKIRSTSRFLEATGAVPVSIPVPQMFTSLQRRVVDGVMSIWAGYTTFKLGEVTDYVLKGPFGTGTHHIIINAKFLDTLPAKGRKALLDHSGEKLSRLIGRLYDEDAKKNEALAIKQGKTISDVSDAGVAYLKTAYQPILDSELARIPQGRKVYDAYIAELKKARAGM